MLSPLQKLLFPKLIHTLCWMGIPSRNLPTEIL